MNSRAPNAHPRSVKSGTGQAHYLAPSPQSR